MDEIPYWRKGTLEKYEPYGDYVVVKFSRWAFEKFRQAKDILGTQMTAVGEVMSIGKTFKETFQKSIRSLSQMASFVPSTATFASASHVDSGRILDLLLLHITIADSLFADVATFEQMPSCPCEFA